MRLLKEPGANGQVFNFGSQEEVTIHELAQRIAARVECDVPIELIPYDKVFEADGYEDMRRRVPDTAKVQSLTGWQPTRTLDDILTETIAEAEVELAAIAALGN